jgi:hypothetical protein
VIFDQILAEVKRVTGFMSWGVFPNGRTGLSSLLDPVLESSSLDPLESSLLDPLLESLLLVPLESPLLNRLLECSFLEPLLESSSLDPP